jgi:methyl-accepting chemotaxis protein
MQRSHEQAQDNALRSQQAFDALEQIRHAVGIITEMNVQIACNEKGSSASRSTSLFPAPQSGAGHHHTGLGIVGLL